MAKGGVPGTKIDGNKLYNKMIEREIDKNRLAKMMGVTPNTINTWLRSKYGLRDNSLSQLTAILNCEVEDILPDPKPEPVKEEMAEEREFKGSYVQTTETDVFKEYMTEMRLLIEEERKEKEELMTMLKNALNMLQVKTNEQAIEIGHISMELCDYGFRQFKKQATEKANLVMSRHKEYKSTNAVWSDAFKMLRAEYGVVWEQEKKEFLEVNGYSPASTLQLCFWIEANKPTYHNLFMSKLDTLAK